MSDFYINWIDKMTIVDGEVYPFWWHEDDDNLKDFHNAFSDVGFCPLCGENWMVHFKVHANVEQTSIVGVDFRKYIIKPDACLKLPQTNAEILEKGGFGEIIKGEQHAKRTSKKHSQRPTLTDY